MKTITKLIKEQDRIIERIKAVDKMLKAISKKGESGCSLGALCKLETMYTEYREHLDREAEYLGEMIKREDEIKNVEIIRI